jgi:hypothetical protein
MTDIRTQMISHGLAEANSKISAAGWHCQCTFDIVEAQSGSCY